MPFAAGMGLKYAWVDHDPAYLHQTPPVQNTWYTVAHVYDFRSLLFAIQYDDDEHTVPTYEVKWTIDGNIYFIEVEAEDNTQIYIRKDKYPSSGGTLGLFYNNNIGGMSLYQDKRGLDGLFQVRITSVVGTNAWLDSWLLYETLEVT